MSSCQILPRLVIISKRQEGRGGAGWGRTLQYLSHGKVVDFLKFDVLQQQGVHVDKPAERLPTGVGLEIPQDVSLHDLVLEPFELLECLGACFRAMVALARREEDTGFQVQFEDLAPLRQIPPFLLSFLWWLRHPGDLLSKNTDFLQELLLFLPLKRVQI